MTLLGRPKPKQGSGQTVVPRWSEECQQSFDELKRRLPTIPLLAYADFSLALILKVDASYSGLWAVLSQEQAVKVHHIAYAS